MTQCVVGVSVCKGLEYILPVITHVLGIFEFESPSDLGICHAFIFSEVIKEFLIYLSVG